MSLTASQSPALTSVISEHDQSLQIAINAIRLQFDSDGPEGTVRISSNGSQFDVSDVSNSGASGQRGSYVPLWAKIIGVHDPSTGLTQPIPGGSEVCYGFLGLPGSVKNNDGTLLQELETGAVTVRHVRSLERVASSILASLDQERSRVRSIIGAVRNDEAFTKALNDPESKETVLRWISEGPSSAAELRASLERLRPREIIELDEHTDTEGEEEDDADKADEEPVKDV